MYAVVMALNGGGFSVTDQTGTTYDFAQASGSSWLISQITDETGRAETFGYSSGQLATITSTVSGRALHFTWSTPSGASAPHVATVSTDPVASGQPGTALTWTYGYNGDLLTSVCPPGTTTACTTYGYVTNGSHAATSVLNANPTSYYRLDDPAGATTAANQIPVDDLTTVDPPAAEIGHHRRGGGPGYRGDRDRVQRDQFVDPAGRRVVHHARHRELVLPDPRQRPGGDHDDRAWRSASGSRPPAPRACCSARPARCRARRPASRHVLTMPLLWIGSNGHLEGLGSTGHSVISSTNYTATALSSPAAVNDGAWHQAVLVPGQALYLDGAKVATGTASVTLPAGAAVLLGAGVTAGSQCSNCMSGSSTGGSTSTGRWRTYRSTRTSCPAPAPSRRSTPRKRTRRRN